MNIKKSRHIDMYHGVEVADPYNWLEEMQSEEVREFITEENALTENYLKQIPFRNKIKSRLTQLADYKRYSSLKKAGDYYLYFKNDGLLNQDILYKQKGINGVAEILFDPNELSMEGTISLTHLSISKDKKYLAYALSEDGSDWEEIHILDIELGEKLPDILKWVRYSNISWYKDGFFYNRYDEVTGDKFREKNQSPGVYFHIPGTGQEQDKLIFREKDDPEKFVGIFSSEDDNYLFRNESVSSYYGSRLFFRDAKKHESEFKALTEDFKNVWFLLGSEKSDLYLATNMNATKYKVVKYCTIEDKFSDVIPENEFAIEDAVISLDKIIVKYLKDAHNVLYVYDLSGKFENEIKLPGIGSVIISFAERSSCEFMFTFSTFSKPDVIYIYDTNTKNLKVFKENENKFDTDSIETKQVFYESKDGTKIPMFLIYKKGLTLNGNNPALLYAYGGFNISQTPNFKSSRILFIENGGIFAVANIRGGGEYGEEWHKAGTQFNKQNVFDDFIAAAEYLISNNYTSSEKLAVQGRSNGGLLIGTVINQRPDLFKVALPGVGVMDMLKFHKYTVGYNWIADYGSSDDPVHFKNLIKYSPLHNIKEQNYPATLITTSDHDDRVVPLHSYKYAATLQEKHTGENQVLLRVESHAGHGAGIPVSKAISETTDVWSFVFFNLGMEIKAK